jgi:hypothetical protein
MQIKKVKKLIFVLPMHAPPLFHADDLHSHVKVGSLYAESLPLHPVQIVAPVHPVHLLSQA